MYYVTWDVCYNNSGTVNLFYTVFTHQTVKSKGAGSHTTQRKYRQ